MIGWNSAYLAINLFHISVLLLDKVTIALPRETRGIYQRYFSTLSTREFKKLIMSNGFCTFQDQDIIREHDIPDRLYIVLRGKISIVRDERTLATLGAGDFIGEMSFLSKEPASASAYADNFVQCAYWTHDDLEKLRLKNPPAYEKFIAIVGCDLVRKLRHKTDKQLQPSAELDYVI